MSTEKKRTKHTKTFDILGKVVTPHYELEAMHYTATGCEAVIEDGDVKYKISVDVIPTIQEIKEKIKNGETKIIPVKEPKNFEDIMKQFARLAGVEEPPEEAVLMNEIETAVNRLVHLEGLRGASKKIQNMLTK